MNSGLRGDPKHPLSPAQPQGALPSGGLQIPNSKQFERGLPRFPKYGFPFPRPQRLPEDGEPPAKSSICIFRVPVAQRSTFVHYEVGLGRMSHRLDA